ncbi:zinc-binding alcohol dehydrogenase family protein NDAI_0I00540 [Naumovozyma dairenensis CBS 421]|uniref:Enoyl reductase (ER) domain-containing protein n=1 Tax=Naumovozyma dairenensis (strain ATCC 10597 / BCRC 20456 / CBS 421 / NBRC 0211 / NRRL Y-12639) TaxID=1071378 RepID=G0WFR2_NAUDC|nr:hypothetical protein NDAI_0I00540 [Naumovozyma dairenensis CBS 421]CCD26623.1 hypothetical protein NDAI_0I00540 [Naumovozyma dairenensis CBS 421]
MQLMGLPKEMKAVVIEGDHAAVKNDVKIPILEDGCMLIKVIAVAGNTSEFKHIDMKLGPEGSILGCDVVGEILQLGSDVINTAEEPFKVGDIVYSFIHGASKFRPHTGAFAEYVAVDSATTYKAPEGLLKNAEEDHLEEGPVKTFEGAASVPFSLTTAGAIMVHELGNKLEWQPEKPQHAFPVLIWGGATGVGQSLIQLAKKLHAYNKIIVVCSKKHFELMKSYGADDTFDYHDEDVVEQIRTKYNNIQHLIDAVSNETTIQQVYKCAADKVPVKLMQLVFLNIENIKEKDRKDNVKIIGTIIYLVDGLPVEMGSFHFPANPIYRRDITEFIKFITPRLADGSIHHMPVRVYHNGLDDMPEIIDIIRKGKNSGEKLVSVL